LAADHGGERHASLEALLADERVDAVLNTEKPMALTYGDARRSSSSPLDVAFA